MTPAADAAPASQNRPLRDSGCERPAAGLSVLTLNVQAAAVPRARRLQTWLAGRPEQVLMLTETSGGPGTTLLLDGFRQAGCSVIGQPVMGERGTVLVSRVAAVARPDLVAAISHPGRLAVADLATDPPVTVMSAYVPSSDRALEKVARKRSFIATWLATLTAMSAAERGRLVVGGDWNVLTRTHQPRYPGFLSFEYDLFDQLEHLGLFDAYAQLAPGVQVHSWYGRAGNGYRFDYLHLGSSLRTLLRSCDYVQEPRESGLTDHAAVTLTMDGVTGQPVGARDRHMDDALF